MIKNLALFAVSVLLALGILELGLRLVSPQETHDFTEQKTRDSWVNVPEQVWTEYHSELGWYHQKNKKAYLKTAYVAAYVTTNNFGLRSEKEIRVEKDPGTKRIAFLGDSFVFGFGVGDQEAFPALVGRTRADWEALNAGVAGYGIDQMYLLYDRIISKLNPDIVFIGIFPEDFWRATRSFTDAGYTKPYFTLSSEGSLELRQVPAPEPFSLSRGQFPDLFEKSNLDKLLERSELFVRLKKAFIRLGKNTGLIDPDLTPEWKIGKVILAKLVDKIESHGAHPVVLILPPERWVANESATSLRKSILRFAKMKGVDIIDLTPVFQEKVKSSQMSDYYFPVDGHWNPKGHQVAAAEIVDFLIQKDLQ